MAEDLEILTTYIAAWGWFIISMIFFAFSLLFFTMTRTIIVQSMFVAFFLVFMICIFMAMKRKKEVFSDDEVSQESISG